MLSTDQIARLAGKRLIFSITTGRSGTGHLARLMQKLPDVASFHEPEPSFVEVLRDVQSRPEIAPRFWLEQKLPFILDQPEPVYVETSHLFCKGFVESLLELGVVPDLIVLSRPHREVAQSLEALRCVPGRSEKGLRYLVSPDDPGVLPLEGWRDLDDYQLCYWYCLEIERRQREYARSLAARGARVAHLSLSELCSDSGFVRLLEELELPTPSWRRRLRHVWAARTRTNTKRKRKQPPVTSGDLDSRECAVRAGLDATRPLPLQHRAEHLHCA